MLPYFNIIQTLCRAFAAGDRDGVEYNIQRLADMYKQDGHLNEASQLQRILQMARKYDGMSSFVVSASSVVLGENLTPNVVVPVDKETAAPILEVIFPNDLPQEEPVFDAKIQEAVNSVILEWTNYFKLLEMKATPSRSCLIFGDPGTGKRSHSRLLLGHWNRRHHHGYRRNAARGKPRYRNLGGRARARRDPVGRLDRHAFANGHRRRIDPTHSQPKHL